MLQAAPQMDSVVVLKLKSGRMLLQMADQTHPRVLQMGWASVLMQRAVRKLHLLQVESERRMLVLWLQMGLVFVLKLTVAQMLLPMSAQTFLQQAGRTDSASVPKLKIGQKRRL